MTPIICAKPSPPRARSPSSPTTRHGRSNIRSTNISMPSAISWSVASQSSSSSGASQRASRKPLETIRPWSPLPQSSYGCDKCPQDLECKKTNGEQFINLIPGNDNSGGKIKQVSVEGGGAFDLYVFQVIP